jgi:hypothetical protein
MANTHQRLTFELGKRIFPYYYWRHVFDHLEKSERCIEIPIGFYFFNRCKDLDNFIEVGNVLPIHAESPKYHDVVDLYDKSGLPFVKNIDASTVDYKGKDVLSISTIEHMGTGDYDPNQQQQKLSDTSAITLIKRIIAESKNYLITIPIGYNKNLDNQIKNDLTIPRVFMKRYGYHVNTIGDVPKGCTQFDWEQVSESDEVWQCIYGGIGPGANAMCFITNDPWLLT